MTAIDPTLALEGFGVRLEPLASKHLEALRARCSDERLWAHTYSMNPLLDDQSARAWLERALADASCRAFAIVDLPSGKTIGSTRYLDIDPANRKLEIGWTFVAPEYWRTHVNTACKALMLAYAFDRWHALRVQLKAEALNTRSRHAIERLGATHEGTLRSFRIRADGDVRDTSFYSILATEWPAIKRRLLGRLRVRQPDVGPKPR
jgi:RimJ/RimL family protein N-acetyltransferase